MSGPGDLRGIVGRHRLDPGSALVRLRHLTVPLAVLLACMGLAACRTNIGVAAKVNGQSITESQVSKYVSDKGPDPSASSAAVAAGSTYPPPKSFALNSLIDMQMYTRALAATKCKSGQTPTATTCGVPSDADLSASHDEALINLLGIQATGSAIDTFLDRELGNRGLSARFTSQFVRASELEWAFIKRIGAQQQSDLGTALKKLHITVDVNPRYGTWDAAQATLKFSGDDGIPAALKPTVSASGTATPGQ